MLRCSHGDEAQIVLLSAFARVLFKLASFCSDRSNFHNTIHIHTTLIIQDFKLPISDTSRYILNMVSPYLATVQDEDIHGNTIENTKRTAQRAYRTPSGSYTWNRSTPKPVVPHTFIEGKVASKGPLERMVRAFSTNKREHTLTIFTSTEDLSEEDNVVEGCGYRKVFFRGKLSFSKTGKYLSDLTQTGADDTSVVDPSAADIRKYVRMTVFISKTDEAFENPAIFVEQRVFKNRCRRTVVHQLAFEGRIQCDVDYRFAGCGDEDQPGQPRDLILRVKSVSLASL